MRTGVKRFRARAPLLLFACAIPTLASADPGLKFEGERWIPALALISSVSVEPDDTSATRVDASSLAIGSDREDGAAEPPRISGVLVIHPAESVADGSQTAAVDSPRRRQAPAETRREAAPDDEAASAQTQVLGRAELGVLGVVSSADVAMQTDAGAAEPRDETERWVPAIAVYSGALVQTFDGAVEGGPVAPTLVFGTPVKFSNDLNCGGGDVQDFQDVLACAASGDARFVDPFVGGNLELMTPGVGSLPGRPRLFARGGMAWGFGFERNIAKYGNIGTLEDNTGPMENPTDGTIEGQGSLTSAKLHPLMLQAGVGVAFTVDAGDRRFRIKPSFEYMREEVEVTGELQRVVCNEFRPPLLTCIANNLDDFREISLGASQKRYYHGIGPGLEFEADAARAGPFVMTVFIAGKAYYFLGDRTIHLEDGQQFGGQTESASWDFERKAWGYEGGVGVRFRWLPE